MINDLIADGEINGIEEGTLTRNNDGSFIARLVPQGFNITNAGITALADEGYQIYIYKDTITFNWD